MEKPLISVIIPLYKAEKYIADTVKSLALQTFQGFEVIFIDDGSPDNSAEVADGESQKYGLNYKVVKQKNQGPGYARNVGIKESFGEWIFFLDSDDTIQPFTFMLFLRAKEKYPLAQMFFSDFETVESKDIFKQQSCKQIFTKINGEILQRKFLLRELVVLDPGTFYKKSFLLDNEIFHKDIRWSEDQLFIWEVITKCGMAVKMECITYNYRMRQNSIMASTPINMIKHSFDVYVDFTERIKDSLLKEYLLARWSLGSLHSFAKYGNYKDFSELADYMDYKKLLRKLLKFPQIKVKLTAAAGLCFTKKLFFIFLKK